jgi:NitT/TauT family transport system ATP-binding protein
MAGTERTPKVRVSGVGLTYRNPKTSVETSALNDINLDIADGEFISIVGPSGCGKSTFLSLVAGLLAPTSGRIAVDGQDVTGPGLDRAVVFQADCLMPWRTVASNVSFGLEMRGRRRAGLAREVQEHIDLVGLHGFEDKHPHELSGGMRQRVNLARALACDPDILLLDEPFAALDAQTREMMQYELLRIWCESRKTAIFITHQISEALILSDRVIVFSGRPGRVKADIRIDLPRPRDRSSKRDPAFMDYENEIWTLIEEERRPQSDAHPGPVAASLAVAADQS